MTIAEYIESVMKEQGRSKTWLGDRLNLTRQLVNYRFKNNTFSATELLEISKLLGIDLEKLKSEI